MKRWAIRLALVTLVAVAYAAYRLELPDLQPDLVAASEKSRVEASGDVLVIPTLAELTQEAPVIAVGTIEGVAGTRNLARNPKNPQEPDPNLEIIGVDYRFQVERFLKGSAPATILVTEAKLWIPKGEQPTLYEGFREMPPGGRYILFLRETRDESGRWIGVAQPWRFAIRDAKASVESKWQGAQKAFPEVDQSEFVAQVEAYVGQRSR